MLEEGARVETHREVEDALLEMITLEVHREAGD